MKKLLSLFLLTAVLTLFGAIIIGCQQIDNNITPPIQEEVTKDYPVYVGQLAFTEAPANVVSLSPALTEIISELGFEDKIAARSSYCDYPESILQKPDAGSSANPDLNSIISLKPELLLSQSPIAKKDISKLEQAGIRVLILSSPNNYPELRKIYVDIATLFGGAITADEAADRYIAPLEQALTKIQTNVKFAYIMTRDLSICTGDTFANDILSYFGTNIASDNKNYSVTTEQLLANQPDVLFLATPINVANLSPEIGQLTAVQSGKVFSVDNTNFERPTVRRILSLVTSLSQELGNTDELPAETDADPPAENSDTSAP